LRSASVILSAAQSTEMANGSLSFPRLLPTAAASRFREDRAWTSVLLLLYR